MPLKLLAVGDMHLGRRPSRLPPELVDQARLLGPAGTWDRVVEEAVEAGVDAVALAGDLVHREKDFFEAYRQLHRGVERLAAEGIRVLGVVGNHDALVLPRLAEEIEAFELLGKGGTWEAATLEGDGEKVTLWGWSFPGQQVTRSPLSDADFERGAGPNLGLLHCDRDHAGSSYAPVMSRELEAAGLDGWLLGHIHVPDALTAPGPSGYLGSVVGANPGEAGAHGPWLITVADGRIEAVEQWVLAPLRWERLEVDLEGIAEPEEAQSRLLASVQDLDAELSAGRWSPDAVGLRIAFTGRCGLGNEAVTLFSSDDRQHLHSGVSGTHYFIERVDAATRPEIDLDTLAERKDPPGLLASRILLLDEPTDNPGRQALLAAARRELETQTRKTHWSGLETPPPDDEAAADLVRSAGMRLLETLLAQQEAEA